MTLTGNTSYETLSVATRLDRCIFAGASTFALTASAQRDLVECLVQESFRHHLERCEPYRRFAERTLGSPRLARDVALDDIPLIPTAAFRAFDLLSVPEREIARACTSSGTTTAARATVHRDRTSLERLLGSVVAGLTLIEDGREHEVEVINLGPDRVEAKNVWFAFVMSLIELVYPTSAFTRGGAFAAADAARAVAKAHARGLKVVVLGPPFLVLELLAAIERAGIHVAGGSELIVVTAGGWKRATQATIPVDAFDERVVRTFALPDRSRVRDLFNQVELNTVFFECAAREKHVPPWVYAVTRDPRDLSAQPRDAVGLLSFLDASAQSYPCFIVGDDVGRVREGLCHCGREGVRVEIHRRLERVAERGCALAIERGTSREGT